jgi:hypothetical protein
MCAVPNMAVACNATILCFSGMLLRYFLNNIEDDDDDKQNDLTLSI